MNDKQTPKCPYCGAEMGYYESNMNGFLTAYFCLKCGSVAPKVAVNVGLPDAAEMKAAAYVAATQRWQEPNRVLTADDLAKMDAEED